MTRDLVRRLLVVETAARALGAWEEEEAARAALAALSTGELTGLAAECLIAHGADPATAREGWENSRRLGSRDPGGSWAELAPLLPEVIPLHVADLQHRAAVCGVPDEVAARLEDPEFRHRVNGVAARLWPPKGWSYCQEFAWVPTRLAAGVPEAKLTHNSVLWPGTWARDGGVRGRPAGARTTGVRRGWANQSRPAGPCGRNVEV